MMDEDWVNAGLAEAVAASVAKAAGATVKVTNPAPNLSPSPTQGGKSLSTIGVNVRGGVIRNQSTKITTQTDNPLTNPRPSRDQRAAVAGAKTVPAPDPLSELKASNPALAAPSLFTGMDVDVGRKTQPSSTIAAPPPPRQGPTPAPAMKEFQPTMDTTIRQLLEQARLQADGIYNVVSDGRFVIKTTLVTQASRVPA